MKFLLKVLALAALLTSLHCRAAATFDVIDLNVAGTVMPTIRISGRIEYGDGAAFKKFIYANPQTVRLSIHLLLDSPGGRLKSAISMARTIRQVGFYTVVDEGATCASACFVLYSAGFVRMGQMPILRTNNEVTGIGVHRALIDSEIMKGLSPAEAREVSRETSQLSSAALREFDVPEAIISLVEKTPAAGVRFLTVEQLNSFMEPPWLVDLAHAKCGMRVPSNEVSAKTASAYFTLLSKCQLMVLVDNREKIFAR